MPAVIQKPESQKRLRPPQFGLRTLLGLVTACGALFALAQWMHPAAIGLLAFFAVSVFFHVAGNCIGTQLREIGSVSDEQDQRRVIEPPKPHDFAPPTLLSQKKGLGWLILVATSVGVTSGAIGGGFWTFVASAGPPDVASIFTGVVAFGVLGGMAAFLAIGFAQVLFAALWQAMSQPPLLPVVDPNADAP